MTGRLERFGTVGMTFLVLIATGVVFVGGSAVFDSLANRRPEADEVAKALIAQSPETFRRFNLLGVQPDRDGNGNSDEAGANALLALKAPLYAPADFAKYAVTLGDDPLAFSDANDRRSRLPSEVVPRLPELLPNRPSFAVVQPVGTQFAVRVSYRAEKAQRGWSLHDCFEMWRGHRPWNINDARWSDIPAKLKALPARQELGGQAIILDEDSGRALVQHYIEERRTFSAAVADQEWFLLERGAIEALREEIPRLLQPSSAYKLRSANIARPPALPSLASALIRLEADVMIEQTDELFREDLEAALQGIPPPLADDFAQAQKTETEFVLDAGALPVSASAYYVSVSTARTPWTGRVRFEVRGQPTRAVVENISWVKAPDVPALPVVAAKAAAKNAIFKSKDATLRSQENYLSEIASYIGRVISATTALERRWGGDREAWRIIARAVAAQGGREALIRSGSCLAQVRGSRKRIDGKVFAFEGTRRVSLPFRFREDYTFKIDKRSIVQCETLDRTGFWRTMNGKMGKDDVFLPLEATNRRIHFRAQNLLWHLVADPSSENQLSRVTDYDRVRLLVHAKGFPDTTMSFDAPTGRVTGVAYTNQVAEKAVAYEWQFSDFRTVDGMTVSTSAEKRVDGAVLETLTIETARVAAIPASEFCNPFSPGKPFSGNPNVTNWSIKISSQIFGSLMVCIDDDPAYVALGFHAEKYVALPEGEHEFMIVGWIPQLSFSDPIRIDAKPMRLRVDGNREINVYAEQSGIGALRWDIK